MTPKRQKVQDYILKSIQSLTPLSTKNKEVYEARFAKMSDQDFDDFIQRLKSEEEILMIVSANHDKDGLSLNNNLKVADQIGHNFFTKVQVVGKEGLPDHLTPIEFMVIDLPLRRLSQTSDKKIKVPKSSKVIDSLTGQVTGESKGAALSAPEIQVLAAMGLEAPLVETLKARGGDIKMRQAFNASLARDGQVSLAAIDKYASGVVSTLSLKTFMVSALLKTNL